MALMVCKYILGAVMFIYILAILLKELLHLF